MSEEIWKDIVGYEGLYEVSNTGKVRSLNYLHTGKVRELRLGADKDGYLLVHLCRGGKVKTHKVHSLVMEAFVGPRPEGYEINHINECKTNNRVENLEYCTHRENCNHGTHNERVAAANTNGKLSTPVLEYGAFADLAWAKSWPSAREAGRSGGYDIGSVCNCCNGKRKHHHGKIFRYVPVGKSADWTNWSLKDAGIA